ncbi:unnamed protein product [Schistocephalus solidus]|uniref:Uncharacterized protein n=1 Tax=Schistocephalus solidus TaxID=70667 RepID=A0A183SMK0_SCHSO|nr:unnamed protein product [Schistocephalus solidus]
MGHTRPDQGVDQRDGEVSPLSLRDIVVVVVSRRRWTGDAGGAFDGRWEGEEEMEHMFGHLGQRARFLVAGPMYRLDNQDRHANDL